jgi:hypothetical protein
MTILWTQGISVVWLSVGCPARLIVPEEVACCCIEVVQLGDPVCKQRVVKLMVNRPCNHLPDVAQQLVVTVFVRWTLW